MPTDPPTDSTDDGQSTGPSPEPGARYLWFAVVTTARAWLLFRAYVPARRAALTVPAADWRGTLFEEIAQ